MLRVLWGTPAPEKRMASGQNWLRIFGFLGLWAFPILYSGPNTRFRKLDLFPLSGVKARRNALSHSGMTGYCHTLETGN